MHRLFAVFDVLAHMCDILIDQDDDRATVARLARTNKNLTTPCFARLWRRLDCLYPLLNALPSTVIHLTSRWRLLKYPTLADWTRPLYYGAFVRSITYDPHRSGMYQSIMYDSRPGGMHRSLMYDLLASLRIRVGSLPSPEAIVLLPNLTRASVTWRLDVPDSSLAWNLFFSPSLLSASLNCVPDPSCTLGHHHRAVMAEWLGSLQYRCPLLEELHCQARWGAIMAFRPTINIRSSLPLYPNLHAMTAVLPGEYALRFIKATAAQPRLRQLSFKFTTAAIVPDSLGADAYPSLETLKLEGYQQKCSEYLALLAPRPPPHLSSLTVTCLSLEQPTSEFFATVALAAHHLTLRTLSLSFHPNYNPSARMTLTDLSHLFVFEELRELRIQAGNPFHIDSNSLETIGAAFRELRVLFLNSPRVEDGEDDTGMAFEWSAVIALMRTCVSLREISLPMDFDSLPSISESPPPYHSMYSYRGSMGSKPSLPLVELSPESSGPDWTTASRPIPSSPAPSAEETFPNLESFLLDHIPLGAALEQLLISSNQQTLPFAQLALPPVEPQSVLSPGSLSAPNSLQNPECTTIALLVERVFPHAKLGLHVSQFEQNEGQEQWDRFESGWRNRRK